MTLFVGRLIGWLVGFLFVCFDILVITNHRHFVVSNRIRTTPKISQFTDPFFGQKNICSFDISVGDRKGVKVVKT